VSPEVPRLSSHLLDLAARLAYSSDLHSGVEATAWACDAVFPFYRVALTLPARRPGRYYVAAAWARRPEEELEGYDFAIDDHPLEGVVRDGNPVIRANPQGDHADTVLAGLFRGEGKVEELGVPLPLGDRRGVLVFASRERGAFSEAAVAFAADIARLVALWVRPWAGPDAPQTLKEQYEALLEGALDGIAVLVHGRVTYANASFREIFGPSGEGPSRFADLLTRESAEAFARAVESLRRRQRVLPRLEVEAPVFAPAGGLLHLDLGLQRVLYQGEPALLLQVHNATERARREREVRDSHDRLDGLMHTLAHDIRGPLTTIAGFSELAANRLGKLSPDALGDMLGVIRRSSESLKDLVDGLLEYSSLGRTGAPMADFPLTPLLVEVERELEGLVRNSGGQIAYHDLPVAVHGRRVELARVFKNLLENGLKYARPGVPPRVCLSGLGEDGALLRFCVEDNGAGIDPESAGKLFELFRRGVGGGAGVGLSIVERVVQGHGGRVWVESRPGNGSRFYVTLPAPVGSAP